MDVSILKNNNIDVDSAIEILGDMDMYNDTLKDFLELSSERSEKIKKYKENGDMENYAIEVHALKGDSKYLGFTKLAELSLNHQLKSQEGNIDYVNDNYEELIDELNRVIDVCNNYLNS